jgi:hypothetical protein
MNELLERFKEPLNQFWQRVLVVFGSIAALSITVVELLPNWMSDDFVPEQYKEPVRMVYAICLGISLAAKLTRK